VDPARDARLNPYHPERFWSHLGRAQYTARLYPEAIASLSKPSAPDHTHHAFLGASAAQLGDRTAATAHAREVIGPDPAFTAQAFLSTMHYRQPSDTEPLREGLLKAGLPGRLDDERSAAAAISSRARSDLLPRSSPSSPYGGRIAWRRGLSHRLGGFASALNGAIFVLK
jgi:hypothetical protein